MNRYIITFFLSVVAVSPVQAETDAGKAEALKFMQALGNTEQLPELGYVAYVYYPEELKKLPLSLNRLAQKLKDNSIVSLDALKQAIASLFAGYDKLHPTKYAPCRQADFAILDYASSGGGFGVKYFQGSVENFFTHLFKTIKQHDPSITFQANDFWHGHVVYFDADPALRDIIIVFHTKEYPSDFPEAGGGKEKRVSLNTFLTTDPTYKKRNWVYSLRNNMLVNLEYVRGNRGYFNLIDKGFGEEFKELSIKGNALEQDNFGADLFSLNYFISATRRDLEPNAPVHLPHCPAIFAY